MKLTQRIQKMWRGRFGRESLSLAGPLVLQALAYSLLGVIDRIMVGALAETAISGVGIGGQILFLVNTLAGTVAAAVSILAAQFRGAGDRHRLSELGATGTWLCCLIGIIASACLYAGSLPLSLWLANGSNPIALVSARFLTVILISIPAVLITFVITGIMRSLGDTRTPMISSLAALATNTLLGFLLINGYGGLPRLEVLGAALATCVAHLVGLIVALQAFFSRSFSGMAFSARDLCSFSVPLAGRLGHLAWPIALDALFWQAATLAYTRVVGLAGDAALATYFIFTGVRGIGYIPLGALGTAASITTGRFLGMGCRQRARLCVRHALSLAIGSAAVMAVVLWGLAPWYLWFFNVEPEVGVQACRLIRWFAFILPCEGAIVVYAFVLRAGGDALAVSLMTASSFWLLGIPAAYLLGISWKWGLVGVFLGMAIESLAKMTLFRFREKSGAWMRNLTV